MPPFVQRFVLDGVDITSVVLDKSDFESFCDELVDIIAVSATGSGRSTSETIAAIKKAENLRGMTRGAKTQKFFERWSVESDTLAVIVRGAGMRVMAKCLEETGD